MKCKIAPSKRETPRPATRALRLGGSCTQDRGVRKLSFSCSLSISSVLGGQRQPKAATPYPNLKRVVPVFCGRTTALRRREVLATTKCKTAAICGAVLRRFPPNLDIDGTGVGTHPRPAQMCPDVICILHNTYQAVPNRDAEPPASRGVPRLPQKGAKHQFRARMGYNVVDTAVKRVMPPVRSGKLCAAQVRALALGPAGLPSSIPLGW